MSLLVTGSIGIDTVEAPGGSATDVLGGSCVYFAQAASFFSPVRLVGVVGDDCPNDFLRPLHDNPQVDMAGLEVRPGSKTFRWHGRYRDDINERDTIDVQLNVLAEKGPDIPSQFRDSRFVFLANTHPALQAELLDKLTGPELVVADTMNLYIDTERELLTALMKRLDGLVLNDSEAKLFTGQSDLVKAGFEIASLVKRFVVIKKGEHGCLLFSESNICALPAYPTSSVKDPTGAGDCFAGGMMGYLATAKTLDFSALTKSLGFGTVLASFAIENFSLAGLQGITFEDITARLDKFRALSSF